MKCLVSSVWKRFRTMVNHLEDPEVSIYTG